MSLLTEPRSQDSGGPEHCQWFDVTQDYRFIGYHSENLKEKIANDRAGSHVTSTTPNIFVACHAMIANHFEKIEFSTAEPPKNITGVKFCAQKHTHNQMIHQLSFFHSSTFRFMDFAGCPADNINGIPDFVAIQHHLKQPRCWPT